MIEQIINPQNYRHVIRLHAPDSCPLMVAGKPEVPVLIMGDTHFSDVNYQDNAPKLKIDVDDCGPCMARQPRYRKLWYYYVFMRSPGLHDLYLEMIKKYFIYFDFSFLLAMCYFLHLFYCIKIL
jgi:hypothetical protein